MNGKTWARGAALTVAFTVICTNMVGCAPTKAPVTPSGLTATQVNEKAWNEQDVDSQLTICVSYKAQPKVVANAMYQAVTDIPGESLSLVNSMLNAKCN